MATSTLFSFTIVEDNGKLVITLDGPFAANAIGRLRQELEAGKGWYALSKLSPVGPLSRLMSSPVNLIGSSQVQDSAGGSLNLEQIFNQGIDQSFSSFEQQMAEFRASLGNIEKDLEEESHNTHGETSFEAR
jgi:hypothetical protein